MKTVELSPTQIGNSRGIRLSAELIRRHGLEQGIVMGDRGCEIVLRSKGGTRKHSWKETCREMAAVSEEGSEWECVVGGLTPEEAAALRGLLTEMYGEP